MARRTPNANDMLRELIAEDGRRGFNFGFHQAQYMAHFVHVQAYDFSGILGKQNSRFASRWRFIQPKSEPQVNDRNQLTAYAADTSDVLRRPRNGCQWRRAQNFSDSGQFDTVGLASKHHAQKFPHCFVLAGVAT
jgi:hypothetical protein